MVVSASIKQSNKGWQDKFKMRLQKDSKLECAVGFPRGVSGLGTPYYENGASILEVAIYNNYGTEDIPARPFMEESAEPLQVNYKKRMKASMPAINSGKLEMKKFLGLVGRESEGIIRRKIVAGPWIPNSPKTVKAKKSDKPLIDTGAMQKNVTNVVRKAE